ncbi:hypothetical protein D3C87_2017990 [compost metagenome]
MEGDREPGAADLLFAIGADICQSLVDQRDDISVLFGDRYCQFGIVTGRSRDL